MKFSTAKIKVKSQSIRNIIDKYDNEWHMPLLANFPHSKKNVIWYISKQHIQNMSIEILNRELNDTEMEAISGAIKNTLGKQFDKTIKGALTDVIGKE